MYAVGWKLYLGTEGMKRKLFLSQNHEIPNEMGGIEFPDREINVGEEKWMTDMKLMAFKFMQLQ